MSLLSATILLTLLGYCCWNEYDILHCVLQSLKSWAHKVLCNNKERTEEFPETKTPQGSGSDSQHESQFKWNRNSCYLDATLSGLLIPKTPLIEFFTTSNIANTADGWKELTREIFIFSILLKLKVNGKVGPATMTRFRSSLAKYDPRFNYDMMDADEFIEVLFSEVFQKRGILQYTNGNNAILHRCFVDSSTQFGSISLQNLFEYSMKFQELKLSCIPAPCLIIKMPRDNGILCGVKEVIPSLWISIETEKYEPIAAEATQIKRMHLLSIILLRNHHYTALTRSGFKTNSPWYLHDSMKPMVVLIPQLGFIIQKMGKVDLRRNKQANKKQRALLNQRTFALQYFNQITTDAHIYIFL